MAFVLQICQDLPAPPALIAVDVELFVILEPTTVIFPKVVVIVFVLARLNAPVPLRRISPDVELLID